MSMIQYSPFCVIYIFSEVLSKRRNFLNTLELWQSCCLVELLPDSVNIEFVPPRCHPVSPQVDALGFSLQFRVSFMPSVPGPGTWHSSRAQNRHGSYTLAPKRLEAVTDLRSDGYHSKEAWHYLQQQSTSVPTLLWTCCLLPSPSVATL